MFVAELQEACCWCLLEKNAGELSNYLEIQMLANSAAPVDKHTAPSQNLNWHKTSVTTKGYDHKIPIRTSFGQRFPTVFFNPSFPTISLNWHKGLAQTLVNNTKMLLQSRAESATSRPAGPASRAAWGERAAADGHRGRGRWHRESHPAM